MKNARADERETVAVAMKSKAGTAAVVAAPAFAMKPSGGLLADS
jgi:hypothetical protein